MSWPLKETPAAAVVARAATVVATMLKVGNFIIGDIREVEMSGWVVGEKMGRQCVVSSFSI